MVQGEAHVLSSVSRSGVAEAHVAYGALDRANNYNLNLKSEPVSFYIKKSVGLLNIIILRLGLML